MHAECWWRNLKERDHLARACVGGRIIIKWNLKEIGWDAVDWINMAKGMDE